MQEERKSSIKEGLLPPLKLFETSIVVGFLHTREKILLMSLLNKKWNSFIYHPYAWPHEIKPVSQNINACYDFLCRLRSF